MLNGVSPTGTFPEFTFLRSKPPSSPPPPPQRPPVGDLDPRPHRRRPSLSRRKRAPFAAAPPPPPLRTVPRSPSGGQTLRAWGPPGHPLRLRQAEDAAARTEEAQRAIGDYLADQITYSVLGM